MSRSDARAPPRRRVFEDPSLRLVIPALCVAEVSYSIGKRRGARTEARFLAGLAGLDVRAPEPSAWRRIGELVEHYRDFPLGGVDASVAALAESLGTDLVVTLDRRHFSALATADGRRFRPLPEPPAG